MDAHRLDQRKNFVSICVLRYPMNLWQNFILDSYEIHPLFLPFWVFWVVQMIRLKLVNNLTIDQSKLRFNPFNLTTWQDTTALKILIKLKLKRFHKIFL